jgi:sugar lactone lactonase YvrE
MEQRILGVVMKLNKNISIFKFNFYWLLLLFFLLNNLTTQSIAGPFADIAAKVQIVLSLLAGNNNGAGNIDGNGVKASFSNPTSTAVDSTGNIYIADSGNARIRKMTTSGEVTTFAGSTSGYADGTGTSAKFGNLLRIAFDSSGNLFVSDSDNNTIRKITPTGVVTTFAGKAGSGTDGIGQASQFNNPLATATDSSDNVYVADTSNHTIRKISPGGAVTTLAGFNGLCGSLDGNGTSASFCSPSGITVDSIGTIYVSDTGNNTIRQITSSGVVTTLAGLAGSSGSNDGTGIFAQFNVPHNLVVDNSGNLYVTDSNNNSIRKVTSGGEVTTLAGAGRGADGTGIGSRFINPSATAVDSSGNIYVADQNNNTIRKITSAGVVTTLAGMAGTAGATDANGTLARFNEPQGIALDSSGNIFVSDTGNHTIRKITSAGIVTTLAGTAGVVGSTNGTGAAASFSAPIGIAVDGAGNVFVADTDNSVIRKITSAGVVSTFVGAVGTAIDDTGTAARFNHPGQSAVDSSGNVYVADTNSHIIRKISSAGAVITLAGSAGVEGSTNGAGTDARFKSPSGIGVDNFNNVYVSDTGNNIIRKIDSLGNVSTLAGKLWTPFFLYFNSSAVDGAGNDATFYSPGHMVFDGAGHLYVADTGNSTIRKINISSGSVSTFAGAAKGADGIASNARFTFPYSTALDSAGNLYIADYGDYVIRKITPGGVVTTLAGRPGKFSLINGTGSEAGFTGPSGITVDSADNIYVTDGNCIRKITTAGVVTTYAGSMLNSGSSDGDLPTARFFYPTAITRDNSDNLFVVDSWNHTIRKITAAGVVSTLAGTVGVSGTTDGTGSGARFNNPLGITADSVGDLYITENQTIRKITSTGVVKTIAGVAGATGSTNATGTAARFSYPDGIAIDSSGNLYVADKSNFTIRKITTGTVVSTWAGTTGSSDLIDATGTSAKFKSPKGLAIDSIGNLFVADTFGRSIRKITTAQVVTTFAGTADISDGTGSSARFNNSVGITMDTSGNLFVADTQASIIRKITSAGVVTTFAGSKLGNGFNNGTGSAALFCSPEGIASDGSSNLYVTESLSCNTHLVRKITPAAVVSTWAGTLNVSGSTDAIGTSAKFNNPGGISIDSSGNLFVSDTNNNTIRKINSSQVVTTLAGAARGADGSGAGVNFDHPTGMTIDISGNLFITDTNNFTVRKITSGGVVSTVAGSAGAQAYTNGTGTAARFKHPQGISVDSSGNLFISEKLDHTIRKITTGSVVSTWAGTAFASGFTDATGTSAMFNNPNGIAIDNLGNLYVADSDNNNIRKITSGQVVTTFAGASVQGADGISGAAMFNQPSGIAIDSGGNLIVADSGNNTIRKVTTAGVVTSIAGLVGNSGANDGTGVAANFSYPSGLAIDTSNNVFVADANNNSIRKVTPEGVVTTLTGIWMLSGSNNGVLALATFNRPFGIAIDTSGHFFVADTYNNLIRKIATTGTVTTLAGSLQSGDGTGAEASFFYPAGIAIDNSDNIYLADKYNHTIRKITPAAVVSTLAGNPQLYGTTNGTGVSARFNSPSGIAIDSNGDLFVAEFINNDIRKITAGSIVTTFAGANSTGTLDGIGTSARFSAPSDITIDSLGNFFVADSNNHTIRKITSAGAVSTFAGLAGSKGSGDGLTTVAQFNNPSSIFASNAGNLYITDSNNNTLRRINAAGDVETIGGAAGLYGATDGTGSSVRFYNPKSIAADNFGNIYIADTENSTIRKVNSAGVTSTLAGVAQLTGITDGTGSAARFYYPKGIAVDSTGNIYVADTSANTIRKVTPAGVVTTLAGTAYISGISDGIGPNARFCQPEGITVESSGNIFVTDTCSNIIRKITSSGVVSTIAGLGWTFGATDGQGSSARFNMPKGIVVDSAGNLLVADFNNQVIRKITPAGIVSTLAGVAGVPGFTDGTGAAARFNNPTGITSDNSGNFYVTDTGNHLVRKISSSGLVKTVIGNLTHYGPNLGSVTSPHTLLSNPTGISFVPSKLYIINNNAILTCPVASKIN